MRSTLSRLSIGTVALWMGLTAGQQAIAATLSNGWNYAIDSFTDGVSGSGIGGNAYEIYGIAWQETGDRFQVAINSNMPLTGVNVPFAHNGSIAFGDLFFNFSGKDFATASADGQLFAVRFAAANDSAVGIGIFGNVTAHSVTTLNSGFSTLDQYAEAVTRGGGTPSLADLDITDSYFGANLAIANEISTGTFLGDLGAIDTTGLDFAASGATGSQTVGFSFDLALLPQGSFIASLFEECGNDGIAARNTSQSVPEPSPLSGLTSVGLLLPLGRRFRHFLNYL